MSSARLRDSAHAALIAGGLAQFEPFAAQPVFLAGGATAANVAFGLVQAQYGADLGEQAGVDAL